MSSLHRASTDALIICPYLCSHFFSIAVDAPNITNAKLLNNTLYISWTIANMMDIVNIAVVATNTNNGVVSSMLVESNRSNHSLIVESANPYKVTVMVFNRCRQQFSSKSVVPITCDILGKPLEPELESSSVVKSSSTPIEENQNNAARTGLSYLCLW